MKKVSVAKFGGSSVKDAKAMLRCANICVHDSSIKVIVVSATQNTTNKLEKIKMMIERGNAYSALDELKFIRERHQVIADDLQAPERVRKEIDSHCDEFAKLIDALCVLEEVTPKTYDRILSLGERLSSTLMLYALELLMGDKREIYYCPAGSIIKTDSTYTKAVPQIDSIKKSCEEEIVPLLNEKKSLILTEGFLGEGLKEEVTTLGREGSDFSASLIAAAIEADLLQIWTDVKGLYSCDPNLFEGAKQIDSLSFEEADTMASLGAKVLHPKTLKPLMKKKIPLFVGSSYDAKEKGTYIGDGSEDNDSFSLVTSEPWQHRSFENKNLNISTQESLTIILKDLANIGVFPQHIYEQTQKITLTLLDRIEIPNYLIQKWEKDFELTTTFNLTNVSVVGKNISKKAALVGEIYRSISGVSEFRANEHIISFLVPNDTVKELVTRLHPLLFSETLPFKNEIIKEIQPSTI